jgi:hypothetical protein
MAEKIHRRYRHRQRTVRRSEHRLLCSDLVRLRWTVGSGGRCEEVAVLEDLSTTGANLLMGVVVEEGASVTVSKGDKEFHGTVRGCIMGHNGYFVGVEFEAGSRWNGRAEYVPDHLLDVSQLRFRPDDEA